MTRGVGYICIVCTHRAHTCERECATERVVKHSLIYGPTLFKFAVNILQIPTSSMGYVLFIFTHCEHACERACATECMVKHSIIYEPTLFKFAVNILQITTK
jgi:hypothetical protein